VRAPLPPLPPAFGDADARPGGRSMIDILVDDHHRLAALADLLRHAEPRRLPAVTDVLVAALSRHLSAEEQYLHPTVRAVLPDGAVLAEREIVEDTAILHTLKRLHATPVDDPAFSALAAAVERQVLRHGRRAARLFPRLRTACGTNTLIRLGNRVTIAEEAAPTRPHPAAPRTSPANKLADPAVAVLDKLRDALTRRPTRPSDADLI
jgi:hypothetical protein